MTEEIMGKTIPTSETIKRDTTDNTASFIQQTDKVFIWRSTNHNELAIMENDWNFIKQKVDKIVIRRSFDWKVFIYGLAFPYIIDIFVKLIHSEQVDVLPVFICAIAYIILWLASFKVDKLKKNNDEENIIHLEDIKTKLRDIDAQRQQK